MAEDININTVVKHLANGSLAGSLCVVCLLPITEDSFENIFTLVCKQNEEYCIADVLRKVCQIEIKETEHYNVCCNCFQSASAAYKFYVQAKTSYDILNFYTNQLLSNIQDLEITEEDSKQLLCIPLPAYTPKTFDYGLDGIGRRNMGDDIEVEKACVDNDLKSDEVVVVVKDGKSRTYNIENGELHKIEELDEASDDDNVLMIVNEKTRKKRDPMISISCLHCPVKYRFFSKLKVHAKNFHNVDIFYCKICKLITDKKDDYEEHISTHIGNYQCAKCNAVYRREASLIEHLKTHGNREQNLLKNGNICEICGVILEDESALEVHRAERHVKRYTCYYCGRMYKGQMSFELHIKKHEKHLKNKSNNQLQRQKIKSKLEDPAGDKEDVSKRSVCADCGNSFVDERSLLWHQRLHNNDRPFVCDVCGRGFVSVNRRNQHAVCAHTPPARRCPLCPALFHLRSMVNSHLKKVHINRQNKRRNRVTKHTNVFWRTETVPITELSVSIQNDLLEMQTSRDSDWDNLSTKQLHDDIQPPDASLSQEYTMDMSADLPIDIMAQEQEPKTEEYVLLME